MKIALLLATLILFATCASANPGAIWTTLNDCGSSQQDVNHFNIGDHVFINGDDFSSASVAWDITGQPGGASCDPNMVVASGNENVGTDGTICFDAYTVQPGDCGEYKATAGNKHDNYRVDVNEVPEFGLIAGTVAIAGAVAGFIFLRKKK